MLCILPWLYVFTHDDKKAAGLQGTSLSFSSMRWSLTYLSLFNEISRCRASCKGVILCLSLFCPACTLCCFSFKPWVTFVTSTCVTDLWEPWMQLDCLQGHVAFMPSQYLLWILFLILSTGSVDVLQLYQKLSSLCGSFFCSFQLVSGGRGVKMAFICHFYLKVSRLFLSWVI